mmetsp:Transcript_44577/g.115338  ORF Transcript_44577/g.115338 Transcript_44577/m.115338 type:complete len:272 (+) Transcript_44577:69-884(+)
MTPSVRRVRDLAAGPVVVVKHTFLEVVGAAPRGKIRRHRTEPAMSRPAEPEVDRAWDAVEVPREPSPRRPRGSAAVGSQAAPVPCAAAPQAGSASSGAGPGSVSASGPAATQQAALAESGAAPATPGQPRTTVILRNLPTSYSSRCMLLEMLDSEGFLGKCNFVYLPISFNHQAGLGYAFVNLADPSYATDFGATFDGYRKWKMPSDKVCQVAWSGQFQGLDANIERYRNSAVMHKSIPEEYKPCVLVDGVVSVFPKPTKALPIPPRVKRS